MLNLFTIQKEGTPIIYQKEKKEVPIMWHLFNGLIFGLLIWLAPSLTFAQSGTAMEFGGTTYYNFNGITATGEPMLSRAGLAAGSKGSPNRHDSSATLEPQPLSLLTGWMRPPRLAWQV